jgi:hypothetical protein
MPRAISRQKCAWVDNCGEAQDNTKEELLA